MLFLALKIDNIVAKPQTKTINVIATVLVVMVAANLDRFGMSSILYSKKIEIKISRSTQTTEVVLYNKWVQSNLALGSVTS